MVAVPGEVEHLGLRARVLHETDNWPILTDFSYAFNTANKTVVLAEVASYGPELTPVVAKCYAERCAHVFFRMDSGGHRTINCSRGVQYGHRVGPTMFCLSLCPGLTRYHAEFEVDGVEALAYMGDNTLGLTGVTASTVRAVPGTFPSALA